MPLSTIVLDGNRTDSNLTLLKHPSSSSLLTPPSWQTMLTTDLTQQGRSEANGIIKRLKPFEDIKQLLTARKGAGELDGTAGRHLQVQEPSDCLKPGRYEISSSRWADLKTQNLCAKDDGVVCGQRVPDSRGHQGCCVKDPDGDSKVWELAKA